jgi:hypothetical protein
MASAYGYGIQYIADRERGAGEEPTNDRKIVLRRNRNRSSKKVQLGPGKQRRKTWFGLDK